MELRDRAVPGPWPIPPARTPLEIEAPLLDSDVQELLGAEELAGDEPASGLQLQRTTHTEFPTVVRFRAQLLRDSPDSGSGWRHICSTCTSSRRSRVGNAGR